ncbi:MAG: DUF4340 domain-containing protein [Pseudomonadota bacterium]
MNKILLTVLLFQVGLAVVVHATGGGPRLGKPKPLLSKFDASAVTRLSVVGRKYDSDAAEKPAPTIELERREGVWHLKNYYDYPVEREKVTELLGKLAGLQSPGPITTSAIRHRQLGVGDQDFERKLVIASSAGEATLFLGNSPGFRRTHMRLAGENQVHAVPGLSAWEVSTEARGWIDTTYLKTPEDQVVTLEVTNAAGTFVLNRQANKEWSATVPPEATPPEPLDQDEIKSLARDSGNLTIEEPAGSAIKPEFGLAQPLASVVVTTEEPPKSAAKSETPDAGVAEAASATGTTAPAAAAAAAATTAPGRRETIRYAVGVEKDGRYYVKAEGKSQVVLVSSWSLRRLVELNADKLRKKTDQEKSGGSDSATAPAPSFE